MLSLRETAIRNHIISALGGPASYVDQQRKADAVDGAALRLEMRRRAVNKRRAIIFAIMYLALTLTAAYVVMVQLGSYNGFLWVAVATFNALSGAVQFGLYQKRKLACALLELLREDDGEAAS